MGLGFCLLRRFWPTISDVTQRLLDTAAQLQRMGASIEVLTSQGHVSWPKKIECFEIPIHRVDVAPVNPLRAIRYQRSLLAWIEKHAHRFQGFYFDAPDIEVAPILKSRGQMENCATCVRFDPLELQEASGEAWHPLPQAIDVCRRARVVITPRASAHQALVAKGIRANTIARVSDAIITLVPRQSEFRTNAKRILGEINHEFFLRAKDRMILCPGEISRKWNPELLVRDWSPC